jgi:hypothetical protein
LLLNAGYLTGFNNNGVSNNKSSVDMFNPPYDGYNYLHTPGTAYAPSTYAARHECNGHTNSEGGAQNLPNGNILVCITQAGFIYEVDSNNTVLWSKNLSGGGSTNARRYTKCYVEGTLIEAPVISMQDEILYSSEGATYQWYMNGLPMQGENNQSLQPSGSGSYQVQITDAGGCDSELSAPYDYEATGTAENNQGSSVKIYPVPTSGPVNIDESLVLEDIEKITIFDRSGRAILESGPVRSIDLSEYENGIYFLVLTGKRSSYQAGKIILIK